MRLLEEHQKRHHRDLQNLEYEVEIENQKKKLELLKQKVVELEQEADAATRVRLITLMYKPCFITL